MFKFDFDLNDAEEQDEGIIQDAVDRSQKSQDIHPGASASSLAAATVDCKEHFIYDLLSNSPPSISFSPLSIRTSSEDNITLARRDLFDARFQLIASETDDMTRGGTETLVEDASGFLNAPSDLVPGIYEGGLKTWECSIDLAECLHRMLGDDPGRRLKGKHVLEIGCGTAIPSLYVLHQVLSVPRSADDTKETVIVLQDYNELVLRLVTLPNVILTWYMSPASLPFCTSFDPCTTDPEVEEESLPPADPVQPGTLPFSPQLIAAFLASLEAHRITIRLFSGSWEVFDVGSAGGPFDVVLTSETIYRPESLPALVRVMHKACVQYPASGLEGRTARMSIDKSVDVPYLCLVAAKRVYFGVGGGVTEFVKVVEEYKSGEDSSSPQNEHDPTMVKVETIWERAEGVKRIVMRVWW